MRRTRIRQGAGMTLIEVAFAMGLLAILVTGVFATYGVSNTAGLLAREHQAASNAALKQLDSILATPLLEGIQRVPGGGEVEAYAFHVPLGANNLKPADAGFHPLNTGPMADRAGHVSVIEVDTDGDGDLSDEDYNGNGFPDLIEVRVTVAWRSAAQGGDTPFSRIDLSARRAR